MQFSPYLQSPCHWLYCLGYKYRSLSDPMVRGIPYMGTVSLRSALVTYLAFSVWVGKASTHPEKVKIKSKKYLNPQLRVISVKSTSICSNWDQFSSVQSLIHDQLLVTQWTTSQHATLFITSSWSLLKLISFESVMPSNHLILCRPLLLPSVIHSIRVFSSESALRIRWPKYWSFSFSISPSNEHSELISCRLD